ncbi:MAG: hypothetical protein QXP88_00190 [Thermoproteota archaeon]
MRFKYLDSSEYYSEIYDDYILITSYDDLCAAPSIAKLTKGIDIYYSKEYFCGVKAKMSRLDSSVLESIQLQYNNQEYETLSDFLYTYL